MVSLGPDGRPSDGGLEITASSRRGQRGARRGGSESRGHIAGPAVLGSHIVNGELRKRWCELGRRTRRTLWAAAGWLCAGGEGSSPGPGARGAPLWLFRGGG